MCEHAMYEAVTHAHNRILYGKRVTDFPHVRRSFVDAHARLIAMKAFGDRAIDYFRSADPQDRRYLLFNPVTKMKMTTEGEKVIGLLGTSSRQTDSSATPTSAARAKDVGALAKLEGYGARQPRVDLEVHAELPVRADRAAAGT
jgi:acyl-CoA dehydrogenase